MKPLDIEVIERGWLSSNSILLGDGADATLIDTGYVSQSEQTECLVRHALRGRHLTRIVNTHLHSDHCGGNARLQRAFACEVWIPPGQWNAVVRWDTDALSYGQTGQRCDRFVPSRILEPGSTLRVGAREWQVHPAGGHDPHSVILFEPSAGVLLSADALWEHGFGVVFPELEGIDAFDEVSSTLDLIESLNPRRIIPGHGKPFTDASGAIERARRRLDAMAGDPARHARHAAKVLLMFRLLETRSESIDGFLARAESIDLVLLIHLRHFAAVHRRRWLEGLIDELVSAGVARREGGTLSCH